MKKIWVGLLFSFSVVISYAQTAMECYEKAMTYKSAGNAVETAKILEKALEIDANNRSYQEELADAYYTSRAYLRPHRCTNLFFRRMKKILLTSLVWLKCIV